MVTCSHPPTGIRHAPARIGYQLINYIHNQLPYLAHLWGWSGWGRILGLHPLQSSQGDPNHHHDSNMVLSWLSPPSSLSLSPSSLPPSLPLLSLSPPPLSLSLPLLLLSLSLSYRHPLLKPIMLSVSVRCWESLQWPRPLITAGHYPVQYPVLSLW